MSFIDVMKAINELSKTSVYVGIPGLGVPGQSARTDSSGITNAELGYIHETGSPAQNIPARPFLRPGVNDSKKRWSRYLEQAATAAMKGDKDVMHRAFEAAGSVAASAVKNKITAGIPPPIKPATMAARARHRGGKTKAQRAKRAAERAAYRRLYGAHAKADWIVSDTNITPLVDTAQLLNSITYVVEKAKT